MKKGIIITISVIATAALGYFIFRKFADRNKEIIEDGTFTIKIDDTASTGAATPQDFTGNESDYYDYYSYGSSEAPSWGYGYYEDAPNTDEYYV